MNLKIILEVFYDIKNFISDVLRIFCGMKKEEVV